MLNGFVLASEVPEGTTTLKASVDTGGPDD